MTSRRPETARPRLLVLASTYPRWRGDHEPGFVHELAKRLTSDFEVMVLSPHAPGAPGQDSLDGVHVNRYRYAPAKLETLVNDGGIVTNLSRQPWKWLLVPMFLICLALHLWRLSRTFRPDVIHAHWLVPQGLVVALLSRITSMPPFLVTSHGADLFALRSRPLQALKRFVVRRAAAVTVVSEAMRAELVRIGADTSKVSVQPMGVDLHERFTSDPVVERSRHEILFVGRLVEKKGLRFLIDAMPTILKAHAGAFLTVVGFGPEEAKLRDQAKHLGLQHKIEFVGAVSQAELPGFYRRAAVFVAPFVEAASGDREGLGLVLVEAAACGCRVVVSDLPSVRQVFEEDGSASFIPPSDVDALSNTLITLLATPPSRGQLTSQRARLDQLFGWPRVARGYAVLLGACARVVP